MVGITGAALSEHSVNTQRTIRKHLVTIDPRGVPCRWQYGRRFRHLSYTGPTCATWLVSYKIRSHVCYIVGITGGYRADGNMADVPIIYRTHAVQIRLTTWAGRWTFSEHSVNIQ